MRAYEDWYARRAELRQGQVFTTVSGDMVRLDRTVPGDGTKWYVETRDGASWFSEDHTIEPGDLLQQVTP